MFARVVKKKILSKFFEGKVIIIVGARQTGKTTLALDLISAPEFKNKIKTFNCDNPTDRAMLNNKDLEFLKQLIGDAEVVFIDEGQKVESIGQTLKLLADYFKAQKQIIVTGSSSINLLDNTQEALTGRKYVFTLYSLSLEEEYPNKDLSSILKEIKELLVFGNYPEVASQKSFENKIDLLKELAASSLYKDILEFQRIKNSSVLMNLLKALALQIGSEVSYSELSSLIGIDKKTIERYIDLLEKNHIVFRLPAYSKNHRREISRPKKIYFFDLGIRNAIINNFNFIDSRNDVGALWENYVIVERLKYRDYHSIYASQYFWRTYDGSEVDLVEDREGKLFGYEIKWGEKNKRISPPAKWMEYKNSSYEIITPSEVLKFL